MDAGMLEIAEVAQLLDFEHIPSCEMFDDCTAEAALLCVHQCCGASWYSCTPHRKNVDNWAATGDYGCSACGVTRPDYEWRPV